MLQKKIIKWNFSSDYLFVHLFMTINIIILFDQFNYYFKNQIMNKNKFKLLFFQDKM